MLFETVRALGLPNLYSLRTGAFDDTVVLTDLFTHHSPTALAYAAEYQEPETTVAERRALGQALGIVMGRYTLSEANAFALLQQTAVHRSVSVRLVAQEAVASAEGPALTSDGGGVSVGQRHFTANAPAPSRRCAHCYRGCPKFRGTLVAAR